MIIPDGDFVNKLLLMKVYFLINLDPPLWRIVILPKILRPAHSFFFLKKKHSLNFFEKNKFTLNLWREPGENGLYLTK